MNIAVLKPGKDVPVRAGHPWIFSEAFAEMPAVEMGELVEVRSHHNEPLGIGYANPNTSIRIRMLTRDVGARIDEKFFERQFVALDSWKKTHLPHRTTGYRLVHAEADNIPGLIVDRYAETCVFQIHTAGMDRLREQVIRGLEQAFHPLAIVERSDVDVRRIEGLQDMPVQIHRGEVKEPVAFLENGFHFVADVLRGQKTGFFLDQRDARRAVGEYASGRKVLNLFGYSGAFSVYAAGNGATKVTTVDISEPALQAAEQHLRLNGHDPDDETRLEFIQADVMDILDDRSALPCEHDVIICDPPAFAKSAKHIPQAIKAYTDVNAQCLRRLDRGGLLVTSSCSGRIDAETFRNILRLAAGKAHRDVRLVAWIGHAIDHAERFAFPEGRYLKTAILEVRDVWE